MASFECRRELAKRKPLEPDGAIADLRGQALGEAVRNIARIMPQALSSTAQDLLAGRRTEIDDLNGFVVRRGQALGVPTPVNETLRALVKFVETEKARAAQA